MSQLNTIGKVILAGAGPGDPELITLKLQLRLEDAEVIIVDRLVNPAIIEEFANEDALVLMTGKQGYHDGSVAQEDINKLLVKYALDGKTVLRLKGGDVAFFSNVLDELFILHDNKIPYEIIPGITAASGASAYTGIPLTARGYAKGVQFITFNTCSYYSPDKWKSLANSTDTLVFYMAAKSIFSLSEILLRYSRNPQGPLAVIEQASTLHQKVHVSTIKDVAEDFKDKTFSSPSLVIVGAVVSLYEKFKWYEAGEKGTVFKDLTFNLF